MNFGKTYHNFYHVCIKAIKENKDNIMNKNECIKNIETLSYSKLNKKKPKNHRSLSYLYYHKSVKPKKELQTLQKILVKYNHPETLPQITQKTQEMYPTTKATNNIKEEITKLKTNLAPKLSRKSIVIYDVNKSRNQNISKRYATFKKILEYLESNNITLKEFIDRNPFQSRPYQIPKSFEFLSAVKFKNYKFVLEALKFSNDYLFCFDYYGQTAYHWATKLGNIKMLSILIDSGKHHNQKDFEGRTPLYLAAVNNDKNICEMLVRNRANVHLRDNKGRSAADVAVNKELKYYLGDLLAQPYSNPSIKERIANFLREREGLIQSKIKIKKFGEIQQEIKEIENKEEKKDK